MKTTKSALLFGLAFSCTSVSAGEWESFYELFGQYSPGINDFRLDPNNRDRIYMGAQSSSASAFVADYSSKTISTLLTGASSIAVNSSNPDHLTASTWDYYDLNIGAVAPQTITQSFDGGNTWSEVANSSNIPTYDFRHINYSLNGSGRLFLYTIELSLSTISSNCCYGLSISDDQGESWTAATGISTNRAIGPLTFNRNNPDEMYAKSNADNQIFRSIDGGSSWDPALTLPINTLFSGAADIEAGFNPGTVYTGARKIVDEQLNTEAVILKTEDGGLSWGTIDIGKIFPNIAEIFAIEASDYIDGLVYFAGLDSNSDSISIFKSIDDGGTWELLPAQITGGGFPVGTITELVSSSVGPGGDVILYASDGIAPYRYVDSLSSVPLPPALYLFGSGLLGLVGMARHKKRHNC